MIEEDRALRYGVGVHAWASDECGLNCRIDYEFHSIYHRIDDVLYFLQNPIGEPNDHRSSRIDLRCNLDVGDIPCIGSISESPSNNCQAAGN